ncbi:hypothetical protein [Fictibacillus gelatini]|uniref:hypothetical protein n=1 Tax=Fictibacillus gelatini TaxID=225985 RepID=UPI00040C8A2C|nr:hypothetical protein [Fictibacillus gelatini]
MKVLSREERQLVFKEELQLLKIQGFITTEVYKQVLEAQKRLCEKEYEEEQAARKAMPDLMVQAPAAKETVPVKEKRRVTPEQIRERNIIWALNIGVLLLLIGGLFVATSNWSSMSGMMKSGSILSVALLFFGIAFLAERILHIKKTSFAFLVLGSLFLPIFIVSIGWFKVLGPYLSFFGEGRYLLGFIGSAAILPVYVSFATFIKSRLFVWFSFVSLSSSLAFFVASFQMPVDGYYLGLMIGNGLLMIGYHWFKKRPQYTLFTKEFIYFVQGNLILSTLFMLFIYKNGLFQGFNIWLTAILYLSMIYVSRQKEYHFVFSAMVVYGTYQVIENIGLNEWGAIFYALIGIVFLIVPNVINDEFKLKKAFHYTSSIVSVCAFIYISLEGILLNGSEPSLPLLLAYFIIAIHFTYLANHIPFPLFRYLSPVFITAGLFEGVLLASSLIDVETVIWPLFISGVLLFLLVGYQLKFSLLKPIQQSSRDVSAGVMIFSLMLSGLLLKQWEVGVMLLLFGACSLLIYKVDQRRIYQMGLPWVIPLSWGVAFISIMEELSQRSSFYREHLGITFHLVTGSFVLFICHFGWDKWKQTKVGQSSFYLAVGFYTMAILAALTLPINAMWARPLVMALGIGMYSYCYRKLKFDFIAYATSITTLATYLTILYAVGRNDHLTGVAESCQLEVGALLLFAIGWKLKQKPVLQRSFWLTAHGYLPLAILLTVLFNGEIAVWGLGLSVLIYAYSTYIARTEWVIKVLLYSALTTLFSTIFTAFIFGGLFNRLHYSFCLTTLFIFIFWLVSSKVWKKRITYYFVPFALISILVSTVTPFFDEVVYVVILGMTACLAVLLHQMKWDVIVVVPCGFLFIATILGLNEFGFDPGLNFLLVACFGAVLLVIGRLLYKKNVEFENGLLKMLDGYTIIGFVHFVYLYLIQPDMIWVKALPGIFISVAIWLQTNRLPLKCSRWITILSAAYLLQPYYSIIGAINIPDLIEREVYVLPWVPLTIFLRMYIGKSKKRVVNRTEWTILLIVSLLLIQDGLESSTIYDALIIGTLSLLALLAGMFFRIKSYFFIGSGVLLLNVFLQTRPYWGNLPWWAYLLIAGSILILVASLNEWHKQKSSKGEQTVIHWLKKNIIEKLKRWD